MLLDVSLELLELVGQLSRLLSLLLLLHHPLRWLIRTEMRRSTANLDRHRHR